MKYYEKKNYKIVYADSADEFEKDLNAAVNDLADYNPQVTIVGDRQKGFLAYLMYEEDHKVPENAADELEVRGVCCTCSDCPHLKRTTDNTKVTFPCEFAHYGTARMDSPACDHFYRDLIAAFKEMKEEGSGLYEGYTIDDGTDDILPDVVDYCIDQGRISAVMLMKRFRIANTKANLLLDKMEERGIVSERDGFRKRYVLVSENPCR